MNDPATSITKPMISRFPPPLLTVSPPTILIISLVCTFSMATSLVSVELPGLVDTLEPAVPEDIDSTV